MFKSIWPALASLFFLVPAVFAEARCPGNVASVHARQVAQYLNVVTVTLNQFGSYPFLLDTGAQMTAVDPALAAELRLHTNGAGTMIGVAARQRVPLVELQEVRVGEYRIFHTEAAVQQLDRLQATVPGVRGVLGGDFLRHFDVLIDQENGLLCLGDPGQMQSGIRGERLRLAETRQQDGVASTEPLIIPVRLSALPGPPLRLLLDSGANVPFLWKAPEKLQSKLEPVPGTTKFSRLPPQDIQIGRLVMHHVPFATLAAGVTETPRINADGLMPTVQFRRIYIDYKHRYVLLEPW